MHIDIIDIDENKTSTVVKKETKYSYQLIYYVQEKMNTRFCVIISLNLCRITYNGDGIMCKRSFDSVEKLCQKYQKLADLSLETLMIKNRYLKFSAFLVWFCITAEMQKC